MRCECTLSRVEELVEQSLYCTLLILFIGILHVVENSHCSRISELGIYYAWGSEIIVVMH
jgi:hypothetical protein